MAILSFTATETGIDENKYALVAGLASSGSRQWVTFQRVAEGADEDWGIHFEFNDQINGAYECIRHCKLTRNRLLVDLKYPIDQQKKITTFDLELNVSERGFTIFVEMLRRIFRQRESLLAILADNL